MSTERKCAIESLSARLLWDDFKIVSLLSFFKKVSEICGDVRLMND